MTPLILTPEVEADVLRARTFAEQPENRRTAALVQTPGDMAAHTVVVPAGFKVVYSVDEGERPGVWFKHLSVSVTATGGQTTPSREAMALLAGLYGFTSRARMGTLPPDPDHVVHALESFEEASA